MTAMHDFTTSPAPGAIPAKTSAAGVTIVATQADLAALRAADGDVLLADAAWHPLDATAPLPADVLARTQVLVIEVDPAQPQSIQRLRAIRNEQRGLPVIAALRGMDLAMVRNLLRLGVSDVAELPLVPADLAARLAEIGTRAASTAGLAPLVCLAGGAGGSGTTTVLTHLAGLIARSGKRVCVVDLDLQGGEVAYYVGAQPRVTVTTLIDAGERIDSQFIRSALTESTAGFTLIAAPDKVTPLDDVDAGLLLRVLGLLQQMFDLVLVDLPTDWTNWGLSVASAADRVVLVTELRLPCLRQARRRIDLFASVGIGRDRILPVANRVEHHLFKGIDLTDAAEALGQHFACELPDEGTDLAAAQDEGRLLGTLHPHNKFEAGLKVLADMLAAKAK